MCQKESGEACDSQISQVKHSDCQTTAASQLTDSKLGWGGVGGKRWRRKWWNTPWLQAVKHRGLFIVPSTDYHKLSSVRNTLWGEGTEAYTSADNPCAWGGSHDIMCVFSAASVGTLAFTHSIVYNPDKNIFLYLFSNPIQRPLKETVCSSSIIKRTWGLGFFFVVVF